MYWIEIGPNNTDAVIMRGGLDTTGVAVFISENLARPTGLALDFRRQRLYWSDPTAGKIESVKFDGSLRVQQKFASKSKYKPYDLAIFQVG